ncbi:hypothetical protein C0993_005983 [Termitomyces sp. T159_Od127]|nr:hypothetical protein C0993_005983 [Termitomyces sp. T159_Od127]
MASESILASLRSSPSRTPSRASTSTTDLKFPATQNPRTHDVFQSIVKGRKSWKTLRGGEIVWPPELEAALLEGLAAYQPDDSRETRLLGRFPMRNRFISDFIFNKTGTRRSAKQVGSRLQQLRDTCGGKKRTTIPLREDPLLTSLTVMKLLSPCRPVGRARYNNNSRYWSDTDSSSDTSSTPSTPINASTDFNCADSSGAQPRRTIISIDILPQGQTPAMTNVDPDWDYSNDVVRPAPYPRPFQSIDPTITFIGPSNLLAQCSFVVYTAGSSVFSETTQLNAAGAAPERTDGALLYSTPIVPGFWSKISESDDPTQFTIVQDVISTELESPSIIFSAMFKFNYPSQTPAVYSSPSLMGYDDDKLLHEIQASLPMDCLYAMDSYPDLMETEPNYDFTAVQSRPAWETRSPSELSSDPSCYQNSDDEVDGGLSPISTCLSTDLSHYVIRLSSMHPSNAN